MFTIVAWWSIPLVATLLAMGWVSWANRTRNPNNVVESTEQFSQFRRAMQPVPRTVPRGTPRQRRRGRDDPHNDSHDDSHDGADAADQPKLSDNHGKNGTRRSDHVASGIRPAANKPVLPVVVDLTGHHAASRTPSMIKAARLHRKRASGGTPPL